jgi:hypothetical protein
MGSIGPSPETIAVVGALGAQGSSVIEALLSSAITSQWTIRALTSSPDCDSAKALQSNANVSIVFCDVNDPKSLSLAFEGCTHIFANTAFSGSTLMTVGQQAGQDLEHRQGMNIVRAAAGITTLKHFIWSTLMDCEVISKGKWKVPHFMSKQGPNAYILGGYPGYQGVNYCTEPGWGALRDRSTLLCIGVYGSNFRNHLYRPVRKVSPSGAILCLKHHLTVPGWLRRLFNKAVVSAGCAILDGW